MLVQSVGHGPGLAGIDLDIGAGRGRLRGQRRDAPGQSTASGKADCSSSPSATVQVWPAPMACP
ncbi:hypothetical protein, partial [Bordetella pertussis]|uniref:hypothetical protein n=1 Tax=Bordetella pertussis TaxID=520 RepID=UPI00366CD2DB